MFPLGVLLFALPVGERVAPMLQELTARLAVKALTLSDVPAVLSGNVISIPGTRWHVSEACGGINYVTASLLVAYLYAGTVYREWRHRVAFLFTAAVTPIAGNLLRVHTTILLDYAGATGVASGMRHSLYGLLVFTIMMVVLFVTCGRWREEPLAKTSVDPTTPPRGHGVPCYPAWRPALYAATGLLLVASGPVSARMLWAAPGGAQPVPLPPSIVTGSWRVMDHAEVAWSPPATGRSEALRTYSSSNRVVSLQVASYGGDESSGDLVSDDVVRLDPGWWAAVDRHRGVAWGDRSLRVHEVELRAGQDSLLVWYSVRDRQPQHGRRVPGQAAAGAREALPASTRRGPDCGVHAALTGRRPCDGVAGVRLAPVALSLRPDHRGGRSLLRARPEITALFWPPTHPAGRRCSSLSYARYARSSRLAGRALDAIDSTLISGRALILNANVPCHAVCRSMDESTRVSTPRQILLSTTHVDPTVFEGAAALRCTVGCRDRARPRPGAGPAAGQRIRRDRRGVGRLRLVPGRLPQPRRGDDCGSGRDGRLGPARIGRRLIGCRLDRHGDGSGLRQRRPRRPWALRLLRRSPVRRRGLDRGRLSIRCARRGGPRGAGAWRRADPDPARGDDLASAALLGRASHPGHGIPKPGPLCRGHSGGP